MSSKRATDVADEESAKKSKLSTLDNAVVKDGESDSGSSKIESETVSNVKIGSLHSAYTDEDFLGQFLQKYQSEAVTDGIWKDANVTLHRVPYKCCELANFIRGEEYLQQLKTDLENLKFFPKNNDLYKFHQSDDLKTANVSSVQHLRKVLYTDFRAWLERVTGIAVNDTVDMSCSVYRSTDTLLCHDDELEGRRIAFILYLVPPWTADDGGSLDLFAVDENGQPSDIAQSIVPEWNKLVFFEVTPVSFHQVSEVISEDKCRLSISGWFHGPPLERPKPHFEVSLPLEPCLAVEEQLFYQWINFEYLDVNVQSEIQEKFEAESEIELQDFINPNMYVSLLEALKSTSLPWKNRGPPNKRCYFQLDSDNYPSVLMNCVQFFRSDALFVVLSNLTGLSLHKLAFNSEEEEKLTEQPSSSTNGEDKKEEHPTTSNTAAGQESCCRGEVRCWRPGCYTLMSDTDIDKAVEFTLDARYFIGCNDWLTEFGGYTSYIVKDEDEELLTVNPVANSLTLVYRDTDTLQFVKHINHTASQREFYDLSFVYYEKSS